jgi:hypothetical protein
MPAIICSVREAINWPAVRDFLLIISGALLQALALRLFLVPANLASGGVSGLAQIINYYTQLPIGVMILLGNIPLGLALPGRYALRLAHCIGNCGLRSFYRPAGPFPASRRPDE